MFSAFRAGCRRLGRRSKVADHNYHRARLAFAGGAKLDVAPAANTDARDAALAALAAAADEAAPPEGAEALRALEAALAERARGEIGAAAARLFSVLRAWLHRRFKEGLDVDDPPPPAPAPVAEEEEEGVSRLWWVG